MQKEKELRFLTKGDTVLAKSKSAQLFDQLQDTIKNRTKDFQLLPPREIGTAQKDSITSGRSFRQAASVTVLAIGSQLILFVTQIAIASFFGAGAGMDAYLAVAVLPQYIAAVFLGSLGFVFLPVFVEQSSGRDEEDAWRMASTVVNLVFVVLFLLTIVSLIFPGEIIRIISPGLPDSSGHLTHILALLIWPTMIGQALITLLSTIYNARSKFIWAAVVPMLGSLVALILLFVLARSWGIIGLAAATTAGLFFQVLLLVPVLVKNRHYRFVLDLRHPGVLRVLMLVTPLILASIAGKGTTVIERYLASSLIEGSISHLGYAFKLWTVATLLISTGIATVAFPKMALNAVEKNKKELLKTVSSTLRYIWMAAAPAMTLGIALALPLITTIFQRGKFLSSDSSAVAHLLQVYLLSVPAGCLGNITTRVFYATKETRTVAIFGTLESVAYVFYTAFLAHRFGVIGIACGYTILFNGSLLWQVVIMRRRIGSDQGNSTLRSFLNTLIAAICAGGIAWGFSSMFDSALLELLAGSLIGILSYIFLLIALRSVEMRQLMMIFTDSVKSVLAKTH